MARKSKPPLPKWASWSTRRKLYIAIAILLLFLTGTYWGEYTSTSSCLDRIYHMGAPQDVAEYICSGTIPHATTEPTPLQGASHAVLP